MTDRYMTDRYMTVTEYVSIYDADAYGAYPRLRYINLGLRQVEDELGVVWAGVSCI